MNNKNKDGNFSLVFKTDEDSIDEIITAAIIPSKAEKRVVEILIGPSGSGKTTYALRKKKADPSIIHLPSDELVKRTDKWRFVYNELYHHDVDFVRLIPLVKQKTTKFMQSILHALCATGHPIIIDRTNMSADERSKFIRIAKVYGYTVVAHEMQISRELAYQRARKRKPHPTLKRQKIKFALSDQFRRYEKADTSEGFDKIKVTVQH